MKCTHTLAEHQNQVYTLAANNEFLFSGSWDCTIKMWDLKTFQCVHTFKGHKGYITALAVSKNRLYSGSWDKSIQVITFKPISLL